MTSKEQVSIIIDAALQAQWTEGYIEGVHSASKIVMDVLEASGVAITTGQQRIQDNLPGSVEKYLKAEFPPGQQEEHEQQS